MLKLFQRIELLGLGMLGMKRKTYLVLMIVFLIATVGDTMRIFQYGLGNLSTRFLVSYLIQIAGLFSMGFSYRYYKTR